MKEKFSVSVVPAVLPENFEELRETLGRLKGHSRRVQIDVCDGKFTQSVTFPFSRGDELMWQKIVREEEGLPYWEDFDFEADLMVFDLEKVSKEWIKAGASRIVLHAEPSDTISSLIKEISPMAKIGIAIPSVASIEAYKDILSMVSFVEVMGIARVGFQGEPFDERSLKTILELHKKYPDLPIQVDGAVSLDNAGSLWVAGATSFISGTFILSSGDPASAIEQLKTAAVSSLKS